MSNQSNSKNLCITCQTPLQGEYCHACGEKVISEDDFKLKKLFSQAFDVFTHIDSKLFKSLKHLLFKPGQLSTAFVEGHRKPFMKPFQIFILTNILFFIVLTDVDIFRKPSNWWFKQTYDYGFAVREKIDKIVLEDGISKEALAVKYDSKSNTIAKGSIILLIPIIALIMALMNFRKGYQIGKHLIFSVHFFSFMLLFMVIWTLLMKFYPFETNRFLWLVPILLVLTIYLTFSIRKFYNDNWIWAIAKSLIVIILINIVMELYRTAVSIVTLQLV